MGTSHEQIVSFLESRRGFLSRLARQYHLEFDDFYQDVVLFSFDTVARLEAAGRTVQDLYGYLLTCIRYHAIDIATGAHQLPLVSLDAPLREDTTSTLQDVLPAPTSTPADPLVTRRQQALYAALHRLPREEQQYLKRVHHLAGFYPVSQPGRTFNRHRSASSLSHQSYKHLRKDAALSSAVLGGVR